MPLGVGRGQNVGLRDFCNILTLLPPGASVFHKHMSIYELGNKIRTQWPNHILLIKTQRSKRNIVKTINPCVKLRGRKNNNGKSSRQKNINLVEKHVVVLHLITGACSLAMMRFCVISQLGN